jgi:hypothetical protein
MPNLSNKENRGRTRSLPFLLSWQELEKLHGRPCTSNHNINILGIKEREMGQTNKAYSAREKDGKNEIET